MSIVNKKMEDISASCIEHVKGSVNGVKNYFHINCIFAGISSDWWRISRPRCCHIDNKSRPLKVTFTPSVSPASCPQRVRTKLLSALFLYNFYCYSLLSKYILHFTCCIKWIMKHNECKYVLNEKNRFCSSAKSSAYM